MNLIIFMGKEIPKKVIWFDEKQNSKKNSKVFEQKGDLLNFKANIDPMAVLSRVKLSRAESSRVEQSQVASSSVELSRAESS